MKYVLFLSINLIQRFITSGINLIYIPCLFYFMFDIKSINYLADQALTYNISFSVFVALISVLSAVGICERCRIESGGVYFLLAHTLGSRMGGALGMIYCFGQVRNVMN